MSEIESRRLEYHDRVALQQADQAIRKDVLRALVELVTNSNDSYHRLEDAGQSTNGLIVVELVRRRKNAIIRVRDYAEGMSGRTMNEKVGTYGAPTSGFMEGRSVRGLWGRGLKDAFYGLGHGQVLSIRNGYFTTCSLYINLGAPMYNPPGIPEVATPEIRQKYAIPEGNGAIMEIFISRPDVPVPLYDSLRFKLQHHFELRDIMSNPLRTIVLKEMTVRGKIKRETELAYKHPVGMLIMDSDFDIPDTPASVRMQVYRSDQPLTSVAEAGAFADGGLLILSKRMALALTLLKFEHTEYANRIYGTLTCDYLHELLQREETEPILTVTRDGVNWNHPFMQALKDEVEKRLTPLVVAERRFADTHIAVVEDSRLRQRFSRALRRLNSLANQVLVVKSSGKKSAKLPRVPFRGFGFVRESAAIQVGKPASLTLRTKFSPQFRPNSPVLLSSNNPEVVVQTPVVIVQPHADFADIGEAQIQIEGQQVGAEAVLTAQMSGIEVELPVKVTSIRPPQAVSAGGFLTDIEFSPHADPRQRVTYDRDAAKIIISVKAPSVAPYLGEGGKGADTPQGQVMLAELVTEAVCREVARRGVQTGVLPAYHESMADSIQVHYLRLLHEFSSHIHAFFVDQKYHRSEEDPDVSL